MNSVDYKIAGDRGILIKFGEEINQQTFRRVMFFEREIFESAIPGVLETIRGFCTLYIHYDPSKISHETLLKQLEEVNRGLRIDKTVVTETRVIEIPVVYGGEFGPDLRMVAKYHGLSEADVIRHHLSHDYLVYITAFLCGGAYYKGTDVIFDIPRKKTPVLSVPAGAVLMGYGLGGVLTPFSLSTGWYHIGLSPLRQWHPEKDPPVLIRSGDWIRYRRIDKDEYDKIKEAVKRDAYELKYVMKASL